MLQWNVNGGLNPDLPSSDQNSYTYTTFIHSLTELEIHVALLQDVSPQFRAPKGYTFYPDSVTDHHTGVLVTDLLQHAPYPNLTRVSPLQHGPSGTAQVRNLRAVGVTVQHPKGSTPVRLCSVYRRPESRQTGSREMFCDWLSEALDEVSASEETIIGGDFNAKLPDWGNTEVDTCGRHIKPILTRHPRLRVLNTGTMTRFKHLSERRVIRPSAVDVTLGYFHECGSSGWNVGDQTPLSDHAPIHFNVLIPPIPFEDPPDYGFSIVKEKLKGRGEGSPLSKFCELLKERETGITQAFTHSGNIEEVAETLQRCIIAAALETGIVRRGPIGRKPDSPRSHWSIRCQLIRAEIRRISKKLSRQGNSTTSRTGLIAKLTASQAELSQEISHLKRQGWRSFTSGLRSNTPSATVWNKLRSVRRSRLRRNGEVTQSVAHLRTANGEFALSDRERAEEMKTFYANLHSGRNPTTAAARRNKRTVDTYLTERHLHHPSPSGSRLLTEEELAELSAPASDQTESDTLEDLNQPLTEKELWLALKDQKASSSPGEDGLGYALLKSCPQFIHDLHLRLFSSSFELGEMPNCWKTAVVVPIPKKGRPESPSDYRPISLLSCTGKWFERVIQRRLYPWVEKQDYFSSSQFGFRTKLSADLQVLHLIDNIQKAWRNNASYLALFLDVKKAFDTVWHDGLLYKLHQELGLDGKMFHWLKSYLTGRRSKVKVGNAYSDWFDILCGVPQGGVLSPLLFIIFINSLNLQYKFADDSAIGMEIPHMEPARTQALGEYQILTYQVQRWFERWLLDLHPTKTVLHLFSRMSNHEMVELKDRITITLCNHHLKPESQLENGNPTGTRYPGVWLDDRLTLDAHMEIILARVRERNNILRTLAGTHWGGDQHTLLHFYKGWIRAAFEYCAPALLLLASFSKLKELESLQREALKAILGLNTLSAGISTEIECQTWPILLRFIHLTGRTGRRVALNPANPMNHQLREYISERPPATWPRTEKLRLYGGNPPRLTQLLQDTISLTTPVEEDTIDTPSPAVATWQQWWDGHQSSGKRYKAIQPSVIGPDIRHARPLRQKFGPTQVLDRKAHVLINRIRIGNCSHNRHQYDMHRHPNRECECGATDSAEHRICSCPLLGPERQILLDKFSTLGVELSPQGLPTKEDMSDTTHYQAHKALTEFLTTTALDRLFVWRPASIPLNTNPP